MRHVFMRRKDGQKDGQMGSYTERTDRINSLLWAELRHLKIPMLKPHPRVSECDLGHSRCNLLRSNESSVGPQPNMTRFIIKKGRMRTQIGTQREHHVKMKAESGVKQQSQRMPKMAGSPPGAGIGAWNRCSQSLQKEPALLNTWFWTSSLQNC